MSQLFGGAVVNGAPCGARSRRRGALAFAALLAGLAFAGPATAQESTAPADLDSEATTAEDRLVLLHFAQCVAGRQPDRARALIMADYTTDAYRDSLRRLATSHQGCLANGGRLRAGGVLFAGDMAETLLAGAVPAGTLVGKVGLNPALAPFQAHGESEVMSICVVRAAPAEVEALFAAEPGTPAEGAAVRAIAPHIGPCLQAGTEMRLNRAGLRAMLALSAYRLVQHNSSAAPAAAAGN